MRKFILLLLFAFVFINIGKSQTEKWVFVKGGWFVPGNPDGNKDEQGGKYIKISSFYLSESEISNAQYARFLNKIGFHKKASIIYIDLKGKWQNEKCRIQFKDGRYYVEHGYENYPVNFVSWHGAHAYCRHRGGRLPAEAEWEYAARGGHFSPCKNLHKEACKENHLAYAGSHDPDETAVYGDNSEMRTYPVKQKQPNALGLYDMSGNLAEWCADWYRKDAYKKYGRFRRQIPDRGDFKVHRGGSWYNSPEMIRVCNRRASNPNSYNVLRGFRMCKDEL